MARPLRIEYPDAVYHVTSRGNARSDIFHSDQDMEEFLFILDTVVRKFNWLCHAYCLMDNHYHLLIETPDGNLSLGMRQLNGIYTQKYNYLHGKTGHVFCKDDEKKGRNKNIYTAHVKYGYRLNEISEYLGIHYTTVSKVLKNAERN
jgi:REP element-mobilizing transposase RayT